MQGSLYERIGGDPTIMAAVNPFYDKLMKDELTRPFFASLDLGAQVQKQIAFMSRALGELGVQPDLVDEALTTIGGMRNEVLGR